MPTPRQKNQSNRLNASFTKTFQRDWDKLLKAGIADMKAVEHVMTLILDNDAPLPAEYRDHALRGTRKGQHPRRDCHVQGDLVLIYVVDKTQGIVVFERLGSHAALFG